MKDLLHSEKGQVLLLVALMLVVLLGVAGLALEAGMAYGLKTKLRAAADGAALAAGKAISPDTAAARERAKNFFSASCPEGLFGATVHEPTMTSVHRGDGSWSIEIEAAAEMPTKFARLVGWPSFTIRAGSAVTVPSVDMMLVLDTSNLDSSPQTAKLWKDAVISFIDGFDSSSNRIGLLEISTGNNVSLSPTRSFNRGDLLSAINSSSNRGSRMSAKDALSLAAIRLKWLNPRSKTKAIVFFTDGAPISLGDVSATEARASEVRRDGVCIFTIGLQPTPTDSSGKNILARLANVRGVDTYNPMQQSGVSAWVAEGEDLQMTFYRVSNAFIKLSELQGTSAE